MKRTILIVVLVAAALIIGFAAGYVKGFGNAKQPFKNSTLNVEQYG